MKILKIQLQNINSLKSNKPIIIDFEGEAFKDIGLFAITGPTGAGKTTILDAIMIALYHKVPRLNVSGQLGLEMVVSYGASKAFVTVDFENNGTRYQAHWDVVKESKTGKTIKAKHTYSIRNLSEEITLQSRTKSEVLTEIENIILLTSEQFLKSVLLAQGEFSAFLKAKGPEKASLLEQITGEEVYKRISVETQKRLSVETEKLKECSSKINKEDLISVEDKATIQLEEKQLIASTDKVKLKLTNTEKILNWYNNQEVLDKKKEFLQVEESTLANYTAELKGDLIRLDNNEAAEPFRNLLDKSRDQKTDLVSIQKQKAEVETVLAKVKSNYVINNNALDKHNALYNLAKKEVETWEPILDKVAHLDSVISEKKSLQEVKKIEFKKVDDKLSLLEEQRRDATQKEKEYKKLLDEVQIILHEGAIIPEVEKHFPDWKIQLSQLKDKRYLFSNEDRKLIDCQEKRQDHLEKR